LIIIIHLHSGALSADGTGASASFNVPYGVTTDGTNQYVADNMNNMIRKVVIATGALTTLAGLGTQGLSDATGTSTKFNRPYDLTTDGTNLYVADTSNGVIRQVVIATGAVTTFAGSGVASAVDGIGTAATFNNPYGITTDGTNLYVADTGNSKIRQIAIATGAVSTLAGGHIGSGSTASMTDGIATAASFKVPQGITTDGTYLYVGDTGNNKIRKIVIATGAVTTLAGSAPVACGRGTTCNYGSTDGTGTAAKFSSPMGVTTDGTSLYVMDAANSTIRRVQ
jgi:sugar lactone lactonase YvrE